MAGKARFLAMARERKEVVLKRVLMSDVQNGIPQE
jgi:hypothetical protein